LRFVFPSIVAGCGLVWRLCQIRLWEADRNRVQQHDVVLYEDFPSAESFVAVEGKARDQGVLLWADAAQKRMAVMQSAHAGLREFIKANTRIK